MNTLTCPLTKSPKLFLQCFAISALVHASALTYFYFHPMLLQGPFQSLFGMSAAKPELLDMEEENLIAEEKNQELKEVFEHIVVLSSHFQKPHDLIELPKGVAISPTLEKGDLSIALAEENLTFSKPLKEFTSSSDMPTQEMDEYNIPAFFHASENGQRIASQLQIDSSESLGTLPNIDVPMSGQSLDEDFIALNETSLNASYETDYSLNLAPHLASIDGSNLGSDLHIKTDGKSLSGLAKSDALNLENSPVRSTLFVPKSPETISQKKQVQVAAALSELESYQFPKMATAAEWNDDFDVDITFLPNPEGKGYIFSLALNPNYDISSHSLKHNLYFILDRSNSVQKHRFAVFKRGVLKALSSMQQGDTFNIIVMDKRAHLFRKESAPVSMKNIQAAEEFLDKQEAGGLFTASDIYTSLDKILPSIPDNEEFHTALLLTDGKSGMNASRKQSALKKWVEKNNKKVALYACAVGRDNDLVSLDLLSSISGGELLYSDTHASFPRKLAKLVLDLKDPVAKDLMITAVPTNPNSHIELYPTSSHLPSLYGHHPFILIGQIDEPCAFDLVIQGRHRDQWIAIKKEISFIDGHKGDQELEKQWVAQHANVCYSKFLEQGKAAYLKEAKDILKRSRAEIAFE